MLIIFSLLKIKNEIAELLFKEPYYNAATSILILNDGWKLRAVLRVHFLSEGT